MKLFLAAMAMFLSAGATPAQAQQGGAPASPCMKMPGCPEPLSQPPGAQPAGDQQPAPQKQGGDLMTMRPENFLQAIAGHTTSGTSAEPTSTPTPMLMAKKGAWMLMFHANVFLADQQQSRPRGGDKFFSTNWFMGMAQRRLGPGVFTVRAMLSLEPATITGRQYPLLFQQGETSFGLPIADAQHPHNAFMELGLLYDLKIGERGLLSLYAAPVGDPALGPTAYPHRASASENPLAPLGHHQEDSTHISADVVTVGWTSGISRVEASGFHGREPDESRWSINQGRVDSWSTRLTVQPGKNWSAQLSYGRITSPEALSPGENQERMTASAMYNRPFDSGNWATSIIWGRTNSLPGRAVFNSYMIESTVRFMARNYAWTRIENVDRSNELLLGEQPLPPGFQETPIGRVQAYTFGLERDWSILPHLTSGVGAQGTVYGVGQSPQGIYGARPAGVAILVRLRPVS